MKLAAAAGGPRHRVVCMVLACGLPGLLAVGCGPAAPSAQELTAFYQAGPASIHVDPNQLMLASCRPGPYCVASGDLISLEMPEVLQAVYPDLPATSILAPFNCRVRNGGKIDLPLAGEVAVTGRTLEEVEALVKATYWPKYTAKRPAVVARVAEYRMIRVSVMGAVDKPGVYELRSDEMSLVALLNKAGNVIKEGGVAVCIRRSDGAGKPQCLVLPLHDLNVPHANVALVGGEQVEVQRLQPQVFTVVGLVRRPGTFPYPPDTRYELLQTLGFAGGLDPITDPHHVTIYRQDADGQVVEVTLRFTGDDLRQNASTEIKPGDAIVVRHTFRTQTRQAMATLFRSGFWFGASYRLDE